MGDKTNKRGGGGYADHRRSTPYQRPRGRGQFPPANGRGGGRGQEASSDFGAAFRRPSPASSGPSTSGGGGGFGEAFRRPPASSSSDRPSTPSGSGFGQAFCPPTPSGSGFGSGFHSRPSAPRGPQQNYGSRGPRYNPPRTGGVQKTTLGCNYIRLDLADKNRMIWEYEIGFDPEVSDKLRMARLVGAHFFAITNSKLKVYNNGSLLWSPIETKDEITEGTYELRDGQRIKVIMKRKTQRNISECFMVLNVLVKRIMTLTDMVRIRRSHFNPDLRHLSPEFKVEIWPGFVSAVHEFDGGVFLNIDVSFKVLQNSTVYEVMKSELSRGVDQQMFREWAFRTLLGISIITRYNNKTVRIDDIDFVSTPLSTFERRGEQISYKDYYENQYGIKILDMHQPLLVSRMKKRDQQNTDAGEVLNLYVPELCHLTGLNDEQKNNFRLMKHLAGITQLNPHNRNRDITRFLQNVNDKPKCRQLLEDWGLHLPNTSMELEGRTLAPEIIHFGNNRTAQESNADWGRALARQQVLNAIPLDEWAIVYTSRDERTVGPFIRKLIEAGQRIGISVTHPKYQIKLESDRPDEYCKPLQKLTHAKMIVIVFPTRRDDRYVTIKRLCHDLNVPSQVINTRTISSPGKLEGVCTKVIMQINCKLGGSLWGVSIPHEDEGLMIAGLDMTHDSGRLRPAESTVALVASVDKKATKWTSSCVRVPAGSSVIDQMAELFVPCLREWYQMNGTYPKYIVVYRVGIDDGRFRVVKDVEIGRLREALSSIQSSYSPAITYVIVQSRNNTRLYSKRGENNLENPPPGTVLDHTITRQGLSDFYLVSPTSRQGTVAPTHYVVVENSSEMTLDTIETLTFKLTHMYYNWSATIRVPAPCQYAQRLAMQVGQRIDPPTSAQMKGTLFFL